MAWIWNPGFENDGTLIGQGWVWEGVPGTEDWSTHPDEASRISPDIPFTDLTYQPGAENDGTVIAPATYTDPATGTVYQADQAGMQQSILNAHREQVGAAIQAAGGDTQQAIYNVLQLYQDNPQTGFALMNEFVDNGMLDGQYVMPDGQTLITFTQAANDKGSSWEHFTQNFLPAAAMFIAAFSGVGALGAEAGAGAGAAETGLSAELAAGAPELAGTMGLGSTAATAGGAGLSAELSAGAPELAGTMGLDATAAGGLAGTQYASAAPVTDSPIAWDTAAPMETGAFDMGQFAAADVGLEGVTADSIAQAYLGSSPESLISAVDPAAPTSGSQFLGAGESVTPKAADWAAGDMFGSGDVYDAGAGGLVNGAQAAGPGFWSSVGEFANKYPALATAGILGGVQTIGGVIEGIGASQRQEDQQAHERALLEQKIEDQKELEEWKRQFTQSGSFFDAKPGFRPAANRQLRRPDGTPVFSPGGMIAGTMR